MSRLAHALLCDACSDPIEDDEEPVVVPALAGPRHYHRDPDCQAVAPELVEVS